MFKNVIVRTPCKAVTEGITSAPELGKPDYEKALKQHASYIEALKQCGVEVTVLPADENFPDSCFVEDTALLPAPAQIEDFIVFHWNRRYPSDQQFDPALLSQGWALAETSEFPGHSHETITEERYRRA